MVDRQLTVENGTSLEMATVAPTPEPKWVTAEERNNHDPKQKLKFKDDTSVMAMVIIGLAELCGTAILVFMGCLSMIDGNLVTIPFAFGFAIMIAVQTFGHISGSHINPIVTVAAATLGNTPLMLIPIYFIGQLLGGLAGFGIVKAVAPRNITDKICSAMPQKDLTPVEILGIEFFLSLILIWVCCGVWDKRSYKQAFMGHLTLGLSVAGLAFTGGSLTGAHMNPARTFGPSVINGTWNNSWMYWVGPLCAGFVGAFVYRIIFGKDVSDNESLSEVQSTEKT